jgi:ABC-type polysaccharide/polyol phosphate export permease
MSDLISALRLPAVLLRYRELLGAFVRRELKSRIEGSILGRVWPVLQPAVLFAIYYMVFVKLLKIGFTDKLAPHGPDEWAKGWRSTFYLITGILPWTALAETLSRGTGVVLENSNLIKKIAFPSELLPIYQVVVYHVYFLIGFAVLLVIEGIVNGGLPMALVWFPAVLLLQMMLVTGLTMICSAANVFVRDVMQAVPMLLVFWMFTTPVFWDLSAIFQSGAVSNDTFLNNADRLMHYNPMAMLLGMYRSIFSYGTIPFPLYDFFKLSMVSVGVLWLGYAYFLRSKGRFADEV